VEQKDFEVWKEERFVGELSGCFRWAHRNDWAYKTLQLVIILVSSLITVALALQRFFPGFPGQVSAIFGALGVTCSASALKIYNFQGKALYYAHKYDALMREHTLYKAGSTEYSGAHDKDQLFMEKVEDIILEANKQREEVYFPAITD
jgi:hypothetical protein